MEPKFQTSFIPKQALEESTTGRRPRAAVSVFMVIGLILFLGSLASVLGVILYGEFLKQNIESKSADLERAKNEFEPALIQRLTALDRRMAASEELLKNHVSVSSLFELLQSYTLQNVRFETFRFATKGAGSSLFMNGRAKSFAAVALQSDVFGKIPFIKNAIFASPNLDPEGNVTFEFSSELDPALLSYVAALKQAP
ncbi:hypothetical protein A2761_01035 [Candidatus Kaiserbacteria bacterium RIFCSPHIGHO2_01_FULL_51_33]|uniref:PilN domain-containing protein n=1 Tax=Candidatus Kaiserbacteria bacterium RIFCSPLOWO2_01_FULL_51_21 TaxID=1798508 RepID=A0A1F6ECV4_9BACT|nr:MAG: hypothetical protein A2761_01035 [Candidatus Kaiserbacteria bacterium RIFCSPHIGHO2_01_FULL_51_33]OGG71447.1 MAG: hypothetical protein A3A35_03315 [Candidatus Kaiserbacteria bacterium RIFCSPLOWO2_01_FULL_51_21]